MLFAQLNLKYRGRISCPIQISTYFFPKKDKIQALVIIQYKCQISHFLVSTKTLNSGLYKETDF